jgi:drug/metabolite transporter (DMT)-like permease
MDAVGVPSTVALLYLAPAMVVATAGPLLGEWPTARRVGLAALAVGGVWLSVAGAETVSTTFGNAGLRWGVLAGVSYAGYTLVGRYAAPRWGSLTTVTYTTVGACAGLAMVLPATTGGGLVLPASGPAWVVLVLYGLLTVAVAQFLFFDALGRIEAGRASIAATSEPVVASLLATALLDQGLEPVGWLGLGLVVTGVVGVARSPLPGSGGSA